MNRKFWAIYFTAACVLVLLGWWLIATAANVALFKAINSAFPIQIVWLSLTEFGDALIVGCLIYLVFRNSTRSLFMAILAGLFTHLASKQLKHFFHTLRPEHTHSVQDLHLLGPALSSNNYAFPSGHSMTIFMLIGLLLLLKKSQSIKTNILWCAFGLSVCISRIGVGAHWPSDIIAGIGLGLITAAMGYGVGDRLYRSLKHSRYLDGICKGICFIFMICALVKGIHLITLHPMSATIYLLCALLSLGLLVIDSYRQLKRIS